MAREHIFRLSPYSCSFIEHHLFFFKIHVFRKYRVITCFLSKVKLSADLGRLDSKNRLQYNKFAYKKTKDYCKFKDGFQKKATSGSHILEIESKFPCFITISFYHNFNLLKNSWNFLKTECFSGNSISDKPIVLINTLPYFEKSRLKVSDKVYFNKKTVIIENSGLKSLTKSLSTSKRTKQNGKKWLEVIHK